MRVDLWDDPAVIKIARLTGIKVTYAAGCCGRFWSWAQKHTDDGCLPGVDAAFIDQLVETKGFTDAMVISKWLHVDEQGVTIPNYDRWMSKGAKIRLKDADKKRKQRQGTCPRNVPFRSGQNRDQRREENSTEEKEETTLPQKAAANEQIAHLNAQPSSEPQAQETHQDASGDFALSPDDLSTKTPLKLPLQAVEEITATTSTRKPRERDPLWDRFVGLLYPNGVAKSDTKLVGKVVAGLRDHSVTPEELPILCSRYASMFVGCALTPTALLKHVDTLRRNGQVAHVVDPEEERRIKERERYRREGEANARR